MLAHQIRIGVSGKKLAFVCFSQAGIDFVNRCADVSLEDAIDLFRTADEWPQLEKLGDRFPRFMQEFIDHCKFIRDEAEKATAGKTLTGG